MRKPLAALFLAALSLGTGSLAGCGLGDGPHPFVREGDQKSVEIFYADDIATAWPLARQHCAKYDRVPRFVDKGLDTAIFNCEPR